MFELEKSSLFFEGMATSYPELVQNIEIVHENKILLDISYHNPKKFILNLNNSLHALLFFIEKAIKNSPPWLSSCVNLYRQENQKEYEILKKLRDISAHQALVFPAESIITGLYRIKSSQDYLPKIGMGDLKSPRKYSWDLAMKNTDEIFHDLLVFHSLVFMDLDHAEPGECLGITRKWFFHAKFKNKTTSYDETVDIYDLIYKFSGGLLDLVCSSYAKEAGVQFTTSFYHQMKEFNCINTLLEIDLYPSLFTKWWGGEVKAMNFGVRMNRYQGDTIAAYDDIHSQSYSNLCDSPEAYKKLLMKYRDMNPKECFDENNIDEFYSFIYLNHWHYKKSIKFDLINSPIQPSDIMHLQRLGKIFLAEYQKNKLCMVMSTSKDLKEHLDALAGRI
ncbi:hypothetical protein [Aeromonas caviae]|uniref:hypothetical protein n=1 Tax=Aeromonas caviae TaxID=648 RepID=UPI001CF0A658|nr:hypothetical protein [Aeromonas caviae]UCM50553.1 hypothetical protein LEO79_06520 [Aeromonas caviae]